MAAPLGLFGLGVALVHGFMPALELGFGLRRFGVDFSIPAHLGSVALATASFLAAAGGVRAVRWRHATAQTQSSSPGQETFWFILLIGVPSLYASYWLRQRFGLADVQVMQDRINAMADATLFLLLSASVAVIPTFATQGGEGWRDRPRGFVLSLILIAAISYLVLMTGSRNTVFVTVLCWFVGLQAAAARAGGPARAKFRSMQIVSVALMLVAGIGLAVFQEVRQLAVTGRSSASLSELVNIDNVVDGLAWNFGNHQEVLWLLDRDDTKLMGQTYVAGLVILVPRSIWPDKPLGGGPVLKNLIHPGSYIVGKRGLSSYTTGLLTEGLMNFSIIGPIVASFLAGVAMAVTRNYYFGAQGRIMRTICCYAMTSICITLLYSEFAGWFGRTVVVIGMLLVAAGLARYFGDRAARMNRRRSVSASGG